VFGGAELDPLWGAETGYTDFSDSDFDYLQGAVPGRGKTKGYGIYAAVGLQWNVNPQWALVGEYERYGRSKKIGSKADVWTIGARYNF